MKLQKTTGRQYNDMLEVLPPAAYTHGRTRDGLTFSCFLVGEPMNHRANGEAVYTSYFTCNDLYYVGETMTESELDDVARETDKLQTAMDNAEEPTDEKIANELEAIEEHGDEIVKAYAECFGWDFVSKDAIDESYSGKYESDEAFAQDMADNIGAIDHNQTWPNNYIDWERAASDLMYDYCEHGGYYFRNC